MKMATTKANQETTRYFKVLDMKVLSFCNLAAPKLRIVYGLKSFAFRGSDEKNKSGVEKVSDHGTIGPRKYFGSQKEKYQT